MQFSADTLFKIKIEFTSLIQFQCQIACFDFVTEIPEIKSITDREPIIRLNKSIRKLDLNFVLVDCLSYLFNYTIS